MKTEVLQPTEENIARAAEVIKRGGLVAYPTETVYGLGADVFNAEAIKAVYEAKQRSLSKPLIVCVSDVDMMKRVVKNFTPAAKTLIDRFMPGALTVVLDKAEGIPSEVTSGNDNIAVRIPDNDIALKLIRAAGTPICAPSANTSARPSPTLAKHVVDDLDGRVEVILDGGQSKLGIESTVVDVRNVPKILRSGGVTRESIEAVLGVTVETERKEGDFNHSSYSPRAEVMFSAFYDGMHRTIIDKYDELIKGGFNPVIMCLSSRKNFYGARHTYLMGNSYEEYAHNLFLTLRKADDEGYTAILAEGVPPEGIGSTLINRLIKSSGGQII